MTGEEFCNYVLKNFNISCEAARLVHNILEYVAANVDEAEQYNALALLLNDAIGLTDKEIASITL